MRMLRNVIRESLPVQIKRSLNACWKEGVVAQIMISIFDYYLIPYALFLGASTQKIGFLVAIPNLFASLAQLVAVRTVKLVGSRRTVVVSSVGIQALLLIPVMLLPFLDIGFKIEVLIVVIAVYRVLGSIIGPAWGSWVSDYLPEGQRGQYFGWRSRMVGIAGIAGVGFWGTMLFFLRPLSATLGFTALFFGAVLFRFVSLYYMSRMADMHMEQAKSADFTLWMFLKRFRESNFVKFIFYTTSITFATQLAAPYFSVFMLKELNFNYLSYMAVNFASVVAGLITYPAWGKHADVVGTARILKTTSFVIPLIPVLWMFGRTPLYLIAVEFFSGFIWSGFTIATTNFIYDAVSPPKRMRCLAYYNLINGAAIFAGASLGGYLAERLPPIMGYSLVTLFLLSGVFRFLADFILSPRFREVRESVVPVSNSQLFMSVLGIQPMAGNNGEIDIYPPLRPPRDKQ